MIAVPVDDEQGEHHQGGGEQGAHHNQLVPIRFRVDLHGTGLARKDDDLPLFNDWRAGVTNQSGGFPLGLSRHAVVGQQLMETLLLRPALVVLHPVRLSHHHQVSLKSGVKVLACTVAVMPPPPGQVRAQLTGQDPERVGWDRNELATGATYRKK